MTTGRYGWALWFLAFAFSLRVVGQAIQRWVPQSFLPPFGSFQGSGLSYGVLLSTQLVFLGFMIRAAWLVQRERLRPNARLGRALAWFGTLYLGGSAARILIGLAVPSAAPWFRAWIPAVFHLVLAGYVLTLACYHRRTIQPDREHGT